MPRKLKTKKKSEMTTPRNRGWCFGFSQNLTAGIVLGVLTFFISEYNLPRFIHALSGEAASKSIEASDSVIHGQTLSNSGNYRAAIVEYQKALKVAPNNVAALNYLGYAYLQINELSLAKEQLEKALGLYPGNGWCRYNYALVLAALGDRDGVQNQIEQLKKLDDVTGTAFIATLGKDKQFKNFLLIRK